VTINQGADVLNKLEMLEQEAANNGIEVVTVPFNSERIKGLYCDGIIAMSSRLTNTKEKACVLAEEISHHQLNTGDILDLSDVENCKQEMLARLNAYNRMIGLQGIIDAFEAGCLTLHEMAEYLDVTEDFIREFLDACKLKYGDGVVIQNYLITFEPHLSVVKTLT